MRLSKAKLPCKAQIWMPNVQFMHLSCSALSMTTAGGAGRGQQQQAPTSGTVNIRLQRLFLQPALLRTLCLLPTPNEPSKLCFLCVPCSAQASCLCWTLCSQVRAAASLTIASVLEGPAQRAYMGIAQTPPALPIGKPRSFHTSLCQPGCPLFCPPQVMPPILPLFNV